MDKHHNFFIVAFIFAAFGVFLVVQSGKTQKPDVPTYVQSILPTPTPTLSEIVDVLSPDGKKVLTMKEEKGKETVTHTFLISNQTDKVQKMIFTKSIPSDIALSIPYNTFSPDGKFIFLKEMGSRQPSYFVLSTQESQTQSVYNISDLFYREYQDYKITDVTGWGGIGLVVVNTDMAAGGIGPSFWFDVSNASFIKLSTRFN